MLQLRPKEPRKGIRDPWYSPERDLGHIGPGLLKASMFALDEEQREPWFKQFLAEHSITEEDLVNGASLFAQAINQIIKLKEPAEALKETGFTALPPAVQMAFYTKLGQVLLAAIWTGVKDITSPESAPPKEIQEILDEVEEKLRRFSGEAQTDTAE